MAASPMLKLEKNELDLRVLFHTLVEKKWRLLGFSFLSLLLSLSYMLIKPASYQATVLLEVHHKIENSLGNLANHGMHSAETVNEEPISLQVALIYSKFILEPVIHALGLDQGKLSTAEVLKKIRSHLVVTDLSNSSEGSIKKAGILQLMIKGDNPKQLIQLINKIAYFTQLKDTERKSSEAKKTLEFLYQQLPLAEAALKTAEVQLNTYRTKSGKIDLKLEIEYLLTHLSDIDKQLETARLKKMDLFQQYTEHHPFVISLNQKIRELNTQRQEILEQIKKLPSADQIAAHLQREVSIKNNLYTSLLNKIHEQQVITAGIVSDIAILSPATFAERPFRPSWLFVICCSLVLGLMVGSLGILGWEILISHVHDKAERNDAVILNEVLSS